MNNNLTAIFALIDGSGSMESLRKGVIDGFNEFITDQKKVPGHVVLSMSQFNSQWGNTPDSLHYTELYHFKNLSEVTALSLDNYVPMGGTPLLAAMDKAIEEWGQDLAAMPENERPGKVVFLVITDGQENTSDRTKFSKAAIQAKVQHQNKVYNWQFIYLGANQDAFAEAGGIGIHRSAAMNYTNTYDGMRHAIYSASTATASYSGGLSASVNMTDIDKQKADLDDLLDNKVKTVTTSAK